MTSLARFKRQITDAQQLMERELASGEFNPYDVMIWRDAIEIGSGQLHDDPEVALAFDKKRAGGGTAEELWWNTIVRTAIHFRDPTMGKPDEYRVLSNQYKALADKIFENATNLVEFGTWYEEQYRLWQVKSHPLLKVVGAQIAYAMRTYPRRHLYEDDFLFVSAPEGFKRLLQTERPDLDAALRMVAKLPKDVTWMPLPRPKPGADSSDDDRPFYQQVIEFAVSCIPVIGEAVMAYEAALGQDLFGNDLGDLERGVLAAGALLPMAARFVEGSHALYSAERMSRLYGGDTKTWENSLALSEKVSAEQGSFATLSEGRDLVAAGKSVNTRVAFETSDLLRAVEIAKAGQGVPTVLSKAALDAFDALVAHNPRLAELDANALQRILRKKRSSGIKGQLFEEILENRVAAWLADPAGRAALGLADVTARLEFIPGHLITSLSGRQLTDGMLVQRMGKGQVAIWVVFEAKSGSEAALGLSRTRVSLSRMGKTARADLRAEAEEAMDVLVERAQRTGIPVSMTIEDIEREIAAETGGQIVRDIERLYGDATETLTSKPQAIFIGGERVEVVISPRKHTKFIGVAPSDVSLTEVAKELRDQGVPTFVSLGLNYTQKELDEAAELIASRKLKK